MTLDNPAIQGQALAAGRTFMNSLPDIPPGLITHCSLHWAATPYGWALTRNGQGGTIPYQVVADLDAAGNTILVSGMSPSANARDIPASATADVDYCASTYHRNSHGVAASISAMVGAGPHSFGLNPIDIHLVEYMCAGAAALCAKYGIDASAPQNCYTHAEAAIWDSYFLGDDPDCRWDLATLEATDADIATLKVTATSVGDQLRARIHAYKISLLE
jgi:hypothetical protein